MSKFICLLLLCFAAASAFATASQWQTLTGEAPLVIARGGVSGVFPESSEEAYAYASRLSLPNMVSWCNVQLTLDAGLVCLPQLDLQNCTNIRSVFPNTSTSRVINGVVTTGWFTSQYQFIDLTLVNLTQGLSTRPQDFNTEFRILTVQDLANISLSPLWLSFQNTEFYTDEGLSVVSAAKVASSFYNFQYISSPELQFLKTFRHLTYETNPNAKRILHFPEDASAVDASTKITYREYLSDMRHLESVSGILVPSSYIWPLDSQSYLLPHTTLVSEAHQLGIAVYVYGISSDMPFAYDFNYDPISANLAFVDNLNFSVDGILSDFPATPSAAIDCYSHMGKDDPPQRNIKVISQEGASGVYPGCTDLAYNTAFDEGVDIVDCPAQITSDGVIFCLGSMNLRERTTVDQSPYANLTRVIPELGPEPGVFSFDLTWEQILELKPKFFNWAPSSNLESNPKFRNAGRFMAIDQLVGAIYSHSGNTTKNVKGLMITIENVDYIWNAFGRNLVQRVIEAVLDLPINRTTGFEFIFRSSDKSVLKRVKDYTSDNFKCVYENDEDLRHADDSKISEVKSFADFVVVSKEMEYPENVQHYLTGETKTVQRLKEAGLPVYVSSFRNEYISENHDFLGDPSLELNTFVDRAGADGVITPFPATADRYRRNRCLGMSQKPSYMSPIQPGELMQYVWPPGRPPMKL